MIQPARGHARSMNLELLTAADFAEFATRGKHAQVHGEIRTSHLRFQDLAQAIAPKIFRFETVKVKAVLLLEERMKERNSLNVIPVIMRHQDVRVNPPMPPHRFSQRFPSSRIPVPQPE